MEEFAESGRRADNGDRPKCEVAFAPRVANRSPGYPRGGRLNFGRASISVRYLIDEQGRTVDGEVSVVEGRSHADRERYLDLFAAEAVAVVRDWEFTFDESSTPGCVRRQTRTTSFEFDYSYR